MNGSVSEPRERLLAALAEQLKLPLLQIARGAELVAVGSKTHSNIAYTADVALRLIDGYILSIAPTQTELQLEPVSISAVLQDTAHRLAKLASQYDCDLQISLSGRYGPVMANRRNLEVAFMMLGYSFIEAQQHDEEKHPRVLLGAHKSAGGLVAGIFGSQSSLSTDMFRRGKMLYGNVRQPLAGSSAANGAGIFIADSLMQSMASPLKLAKHQKLTGLAATLIPSHQLNLLGST